MTTGLAQDKWENATREAPYSIRLSANAVDRGNEKLGMQLSGWKYLPSMYEVWF